LRSIAAAAAPHAARAIHLSSFHGLITRVQARIARYRQEIVPGTKIAESIEIGRFGTTVRSGAIHLLLALGATLLVRWWALRA